MDNEPTSQAGFVQRKLPWIIAAVALVVYLVMLVRWCSFMGLPTLAKVAGWDWRLTVHAPLHYLVTLPIRWLPEAWQLTAFNAFSAICGAAALGLLARSVALLPHDRTKEQRQFERSDFSFLTIPTSWMPPVLAVVLCGLQLTFWENALVSTGDMFDLLIFAFVVWSLMEFRVDEKNWRLVLATFVYGLGMTNNFAMVGFLPMYIGALAWIKGLGFFKPSFLLRVGLAGIGGTLLYLLLPLINLGSDMTHLNFWESLMVNLGFQKNTLLGFPRSRLLIIGLTSLVPVVFMGIRWPAQVGDISAAGAGLTRILTGVVHAVFLAACIYVAFDPPFSPRALGMGFTFLPFYYLGALAGGYFMGYFLLVCGAKPVRAWEKPSPLVAILNKAILAAMWVVLPLVTVLLPMNNYSAIQARHGTELQLFGETASASLPDQPALVFSDDTIRLWAVQSALSHTKPDHEYLLVDTHSLPLPSYHRWMHGRHPDTWPETFLTNQLTMAIKVPDLIDFMKNLRASMPAYYLQPGFGYYMESIYTVPAGLIYETRDLPEGQIMPPPLDDDALAKGEAFFRSFYKEPEVQGIIRHMADSEREGTVDLLLEFFGQVFSLPINDFGVRLQMQGNLKSASDFFDMALALSPQNPSAFINKDFNAYLQNPEGPPPGPSAGANERLGRYGGNWTRTLSLNGPIDEPATRFLLSQVFVRGNNFVQAAQQLLRSIETQPTLFLSHVALAGIYVKLNLPDEAMKIIRDQRAAAEYEGLPLEVKMKLLEAEAWAFVLKDDLKSAETLLESAQETWPDQNEPFATLANIYLSQQESDKAIAIYLEQLGHQPKNVPIMINLTALQIVKGESTNAIAWLDKAIELAPKNPGAIINRALAHLNARNLDASKRDYEQLLSLSANPPVMALYGLAEIAWLKEDYKEAERQYEKFLDRASPTLNEYNIARTRLQQIKDGTL